MNELRCRSCGAALRAEDIHQDLAIAKCGYCHAIRDLAPRGDADPAARQLRPQVPMPARFTLDRQGGRLVVEWRWSRATGIAVLIFSGLWNAVLAVSYRLMLASDVQPEAPLFALPFVAVGLALSWFGLACLLNRTRIEVGGGVLGVRHFPVPWRRDRELAAAQIDQLFCREIVNDTDEGTSRSYQLIAVCKPDGRSLTLVSNLDEAQQALFLEQQVEGHLGIADRPVVGAVPKAG
ncbi:MAG TPA: hypothetical protein VGK67_25095 [Myxococcales bacterium]|jgi:hypothetical protein